MFQQQKYLLKSKGGKIIERICNVAGCDKEVYMGGLCTTHHNNYHRSGEDAGVYIISLKDKLYVGMSMSGIKSRNLNERGALIRNSNAPKELLAYFNQLCNEEPELSRGEIADKYFDTKVIESSSRWLLVDSSMNTIEYKDKKEQKEKTFKANISNNPEIVFRNKMAKVYWQKRERYWINYYKGLDIENGTHNCLNIVG